MCGIAGAVDWTGRAFDEEQMRRMVDSLAHRGPDGSGIFSDGPVCLGHRRLAIIDPAQGQQPMASTDGRIVVCFNGEIYNYRELRDELQALGHRFETDSDTEVIIYSYRQWGEDCLRRFNGMWALALWDVDAQALLLSRDRAGEKPLYYTEHDGRLLFASEAKALFAYGMDPELDPAQMEIYLYLGYVPAPYSFFKGVSKLQHGRFLRITRERCDLHSYWEFPQVPEDEMRTDAGAAREEFDYLLRDSVRLRMRSDVPFGAFLSGGLDSSSIVALMREHSEDVSTFTIGFEEKAFDERDLARVVAERFHTRHHERIIGDDSFDDALLRTLSIYDEPFGDSSAIPSAHVCEFAAEHVKMVLTGDGGDEVLSGYPAYQSEKMGARYQRVPGMLRTGIEAMLSISGSVTSGGLRYRLQQALSVARAAGQPFIERLVSKSAWADLEFIEQAFTGSSEARPLQDYLDEALSGCNYDDPFNRLMYFQFQVSLPERMLTKVDRVSMSASLECRTPFLDHRLIELCAGLHRDVKMPGIQRKHLLRATAGKLLPPELLQAPKRGFVPPLREWLDDNLMDRYLGKGVAQTLGLDEAAIRRLARMNGEGKHDIGHFLWMLLLLLEWKPEPNSVPDHA